MDTFKIVIQQTNGGTWGYEVDALNDLGYGTHVGDGRGLDSREAALKAARSRAQQTWETWERSAETFSYSPASGSLDPLDV